MQLEAVAELTAKFTSNRYHFRLLTVDDLPAIEGIEKRCYPDPWRMSDVKLMIEASEICRGVFDSTTLIGYLFALTYPEGYHLANIAIDLPYRRQGLARLFLRLFIMDAKRTGRDWITLEVRRDNLSAIRLYKSEKFVHVDTVKFYYSDNTDALVLSRLIT